MRFDVLTLFPDMFDGPLGASMIRIARESGSIAVHRWDLRDWAGNRNRKVDDRPYGGGPGMVLCPHPVVAAAEAVQAAAQPAGDIILFTPQGRRLDQELVRELATRPRLLLLCGHYEGIDDRARQLLRPREVSIGDYVLTGGELAAMVLIDAVARLIPGVLGDATSTHEESFAAGAGLEYPHYTRPRIFRGMEVPEVLLSGDHREIERWRQAQAHQRTAELRPDLLSAQTTRTSQTPRPAQG